MILSEYALVEKWKQRGREVVGCSTGDVATLLSSLLKVATVLLKSQQFLVFISLL